jgi:hypothetical protein
MKKKFSLIFIILLICSISYVFAAEYQIGDKINDVLYTDIVTEINGKQVESFNINGSTAIYVSAAEKLGYDVIWNGEKRLVTIQNDPNNNPIYKEEKFEKKTQSNYDIGDKINDVLYTDIITKINGEQVESFNINGYTAIYVTALRKTGAEVKWQPDTREVIISNIEEQAISGDSYNGEMTIQFSFGERTGQYKGDIVDGVPHGYGEFTSETESGIGWTYKGEWKDGHLNGEGKTIWDNGNKEIGIYENDQITPMSEIEINKMFGQPDNYENHYIELTGEIFTQPEYYDNGVIVQMYTDVDNRENDVLVYLYDTNIVINKNEMIKVKGVLGEVYEGENAFGSQLRIPTVHAYEYESITYEDLYPIVAKKEVNKTQTQFGYSVTVQKVEVTELETRVYIKVENNGSDNFNLYSFNTKLIQNGKQYEEESNWDADYPEIQTDLVPGVSTEGIITYPPIKNEAFKLILEGSSDDWDEDIEDYIYEINFE